jgi:hypothetical protein
MSRSLRNIVLTSGTLFLGACAGTPAPLQKVASAQQAIAAAEDAGAAKVPQAARYLEMAQSGLDNGVRRMNDGDNRTATDHAVRARADAELAAAVAREAQANEAAQVATARAQLLLTGTTPRSAVGGGPPSQPAPQPPPKK